ncbi:hypothetical protein [Agromyces sp. S2-1-8]|uniref:hypothetical protein n=1 Tax=Agromyces sp. S2-1-8 TaxID=2897180 RepID=UPI001E3FF84F|nr:hypothetical protein [Agromyces sp. S2-1-8]MCD5345058.1 hypothetical protein [Agromyces sp. S2-1-8]
MSAESDPIEATIEAQISADLDEKRRDAPNDSFVAAVDEFERASPWLGPEHKPSLVTLRQLARQLDIKLTAAIAAQFGVTFRDLRAQGQPAPPAGPTGAAASVSSILDEARSS